MPALTSIAAAILINTAPPTVTPVDPPGPRPPTCLPYAPLARGLDAQGLVRAWVGLVPSGAEVAELRLAPTGAWLLLAVKADGRACIVAGGRQSADGRDLPGVGS